MAQPVCRQMPLWRREKQNRAENDLRAAKNQSKPVLLRRFLFTLLLAFTFGE